MSETAKVVVLSPEELKSLVREAVADAIKGDNPGEGAAHIRGERKR